MKMRTSVILLAAAVAISAVPTVQVAAGNPCPDQPIHTYGATFTKSVEPFSVTLGTGVVQVGDTNVLLDCAPADGIPGDFDGDYDAGVGGAFFGYGSWAEDPGCGYQLNTYGPSVAVNDVVFGPAISFVIGENDQAGPIRIQDPVTGEWRCETDGIIAPADEGTGAVVGDPDDCVSSPFQGNGLTCGTGGGDGGYWVFLCCYVRLKCNPAGCRLVLMCEDDWPKGSILFNPATEGIITPY